jgi:hypothetical protein
LQTYGGGCNDNLMCVQITSELTAAPELRWKILIDEHSGDNVEIHERTPIHLLNGAKDWGGGYLDTRGYAQGVTFAGNVPLLLAVSTRGGWNGVDTPETTQWWAER